jgi:hypothetical protein
MSFQTDEGLFNQVCSTGQKESNAGYDKLPESIKAVYSEAEWLWLSAGEKKDLELRETEPETE